MSMNIKEFLISQAKRAGVSDDPEFNLMISASVLNDIQVPEAVSNKFNTNLYDFELAKTSLDLKKHFISNYMMGYDEEIVRMAKEYGLDGNAVEELKVTKNSGDKIKLALKKMKELEEKAKNSVNSNQSDEFLKKMAEAQSKYDDLVSKAEADKSLIEQRYVTKMKQLWEQTQLNGIQWNDQIPEAARIPAYQAVLERKLYQLDGQIIYDAERNAAKLVNAKDPSLPLVHNGREFSYSDLSALVLQENKLLKEQGQGGTTPTQLPAGTPTIPAFAQGQSQGTPIPASIRGALADISNVAAQMR
jgi:hypothetical protein